MRRPARRPRAGRRDAARRATGEDAGKVQSIGARFAHGELTLERGRRPGLPRLRQPRRRLPVPGHGRDLAGRRPRRSAWPCRTRPSPRRASRSGATWPGARPARWSRSAARGSTTRDILTDARRPQRHDRPRGVRRLDQPAAAHPRDRLRRRPAAARRSRTGTTSTARSRGWSTSCPTARVYHPTVRVFLAGGVPEVMLHLRGLGLLDEPCLTVTGRAARPGARLVGASPSAGRGSASGCVAQDGVDPDDVIMSPARAREPRADQHRHLPARQPRPRGLGDQEHGDRPDAWSTPTASIARPARRASSRRERDADRRHQGPGAGPDEAGRRPRPDRPRADGRRAWRRSTRSPPRSSTCRSASRSPCSPTPASPASRRAPASATSAPRPWPAARSARSATAT